MAESKGHGAWGKGPRAEGKGQRGKKKEKRYAGMLGWKEHWEEEIRSKRKKEEMPAEYTELHGRKVGDGRGRNQKCGEMTRKEEGREKNFVHESARIFTNKNEEGNFIAR